MQDYWTRVQEPSCTLNPGSSACGDCSYVGGTICKEYNSLDNAMPNKPEYGDNVCASLGCFYKGESYQHGEVICAPSEGTVYDKSNKVNYNMEVNPNTLEFLDDNLFEKVSRDYEKVNLPGSRYYKLMCFDGEIINEPCKEYRNEICVEFKWGEGESFRGAECVPNDWRTCFDKINKADCEDPDLHYCKWVPGYRLDGQILTTVHDQAEDVQGTCTPLFSPGFQFLEPENDGITLCSTLGSVSEYAIYETSWLRKRDNFEDRPVCDTGSNSDAVQMCFDGGCYAIPGYGKKDENQANTESGYLSIDTLQDVHKGKSGALGNKFENYCISDREGYYCPDKTGEVQGKYASCAKKEDKRAQMPLFFRHIDWIASTRERARSLGDCGYKNSSYYDLGVQDINPQLEIVSVIFQKLSQDMTPKDGEEIDMDEVMEKSKSSLQIIYQGNEYVGDQAGYRS